VWEAETGREICAFTGHGDYVWGVAFCPDGASVASVGSDGVARVWDAGTARERLRMPTGTDSVVGCAVAFSPDGKRLATSAQGNLIAVWKLAD